MNDEVQVGIDLRQVIADNAGNDITPAQLEDFTNAYLGLVRARGWHSGGGLGLCDVNSEEDDAVRVLCLLVGKALELIEMGLSDEAADVLREAVVG